MTLYDLQILLLKHSLFFLTLTLLVINYDKWPQIKDFDHLPHTADVMLELLLQKLMIQPISVSPKLLYM